jgi:short-subunit dehydrogenase
MVAMQLTQAVVLVTGASAGIGHAAATRFAARGARMLVHGRDQDRTSDVAREVGGRALIADLASPADRKRLTAEALDAFGRVDVLVNNAGFGYSGPLTAMPVDTIRRLIEVDLVAAIELTHALLPGMIEQQRGAICFVTSIAGRTGVAGEAVYSATKAGLDAFAESLRAETAGSGVNISVVVPGVVDTGFFETAAVPTIASGHARYPPVRSPTLWSERWSATAPKRGHRGGCESPRRCAHWLPERFGGLPAASANRCVLDKARTASSERCPGLVSLPWSDILHAFIWAYYARSN